VKSEGLQFLLFVLFIMVDSCDELVMFVLMDRIAVVLSHISPKNHASKDTWWKYDHSVSIW